MNIGRVRTLAALALWLTSVTACSAPPPPTDQTVLSNFTLIDGTERPAVPDASMVIDAGRITWVGPSVDLPEAATAEPLDLGGAYVIPGLINLHGHVGSPAVVTGPAPAQTPASAEEHLRTYAAYGVTGVLSMGTDPGIALPIREAQRLGPTYMARLYSAGQGLVYAGDAADLPPGARPIADPSEAEAIVATLAAEDVDVVTLWLADPSETTPGMPAAVSEAIILAAHQRNLRVLARVFHLDDARRLTAQGIDGFLHVVRDQPFDADTVATMKRDDIWQVSSTLARTASMSAYARRPALLDDPFFVRGVPAEALDALDDPARQQAVAAEPHFADYPAYLAQAKANLKALADAGVSYGFGTGSGRPGLFAGFFEHWELELLVAAGLTPAEALRAATGRAADFLLADDVGTLEPLKWADFVVLEADPLDDIRNTRTIRSVNISGRAVPPIAARPDE